MKRKTARCSTGHDTGVLMRKPPSWRRSRLRTGARLHGNEKTWQKLHQGFGRNLAGLRRLLVVGRKRNWTPQKMFRAAVAEYTR